MIDRYLREVLDGENRVSQVQVGTTCTCHERSAITQIANGRERQYREYWRDRGRRESTVRSRSHPDHHIRQTGRSGQARERYRSIVWAWLPVTRFGTLSRAWQRCRTPPTA